MRHDRLQLAVEPLPGSERDDALAGAVRLVETWIVIERRIAVEPERDVGTGPDEFGAFDQPDCSATRISPGAVVCGMAHRARPRAPDRRRHRPRRHVRSAIARTAPW